MRLIVLLNLVVLSGACGVAHVEVAPPDSTSATGAELSSSPARAQVSFTFDDGYRSVAERAFPILSATGYPATAYVITRDVGTASGLTWRQLTYLQSQGWEIGSHTVNHPSLPTLDTAGIARELEDSRAALITHGLRSFSFAAPYGHYDSRVLAETAKRYQAFRPFDDAPLNRWPYQRLLVQVKTVQTGVSVEQVAAWLDEAIANHTWLVLVFHDIVAQPEDRGDWGYTQLDLALIREEVRARNLPVVTIAQAFSSRGAVVLSQDFTSGLGSFTTDAPSHVVVTPAGRGALPEPLHAVKLSAGLGRNAHLFSPTFAVPAGFRAVIEAFVSTADLDAPLGIYVDEYDSRGVWTSGQYLADVPSGSVQVPALSYVPTSSRVTAASLQFILPASARDGRAFVDSVRVEMAP